MSDKRNIGITGSPNSGANEVVERMLAHCKSKMPKEAFEGVAAFDNVDWGVYDVEEAPPYDAKKRGKLFGKD